MNAVDAVAAGTLPPDDVGAFGFVGLMLPPDLGGWLRC